MGEINDLMEWALIQCKNMRPLAETDLMGLRDHLIEEVDHAHATNDISETAFLKAAITLGLITYRLQYLSARRKPTQIPSAFKGLF